MNLCDVGPRVKEVWGDQWHEQVRAPEYPIHVVLEGDPKEFMGEPFAPFANASTTFIILPLTPEIAEALYMRTLISLSVLHTARILAEGVKHDQVS